MPDRSRESWLALPVAGASDCVSDIIPHHASIHKSLTQVIMRCALGVDRLGAKSGAMGLPTDKVPNR